MWLQRFLDYWPALTSSKLRIRHRFDLAGFFLLQYALPVVSFADITTSFISRSLPTYWPLSMIAFSISGIAFWRGCNSKSEGPNIPSPNPLQLTISIIYLIHWFIVIPWVTLRMAFLPKKLIWAKTNHGNHTPLKI